MAPEDKEITVAAVETDSSNPSTDDLNTPAPAPGQLKRSATIAPSKWPSQPEQLKETRGMRIALDAWDLFFCAMPIGLLIKTTLTIVAHARDGKLDHRTLDYVSPLTTGLMYVNDQVCP
ncbi:hypothetical protein ES702_03030 [subsurface metagenome]